MLSRTLAVIKAQLISMFYRRELVRCAKDFYFVLVMCCAVFALVTCKCSVHEVQNLEAEACRSYRGDFNSNSDVFDSHVSAEPVSGHSVKQHSLENLCPISNAFCFPSTLTGALVSEVDPESETSDASDVQSERFSSGLRQLRNNRSGSSRHGIMSLGGRIISCSFSPQDASTEFPSSDGQIDSSSCTSPPFGKSTPSSESGESNETLESGLLDGLSTPPIEIKPFVLDWGHKNMYYPSLAFLTVKNVDADSVLSIYEPYSSNSQFYPCNNFSAMLLAPGEVASICFVFLPAHLGLSSAQIVLQTSFGGFLIQAKGFAVESPYLTSPLSGLDISSIGRWRKKLSLFNPFDEALYVEEVTAWISTSSQLSKYICSIRSLEESDDHSMLNANDWLDVETSKIGGAQITLRPHSNWEVSPQETEPIMELDISNHFDGKIVAAFCLHLSTPSSNKIDTIMVPLEAEVNSNTDTGYVSVSLEALVPCNTSGSTVMTLSIRNNAPYLLSVLKVSEVGESVATFQIKYVEGLILFPGSVTQVAILNYAHVETPEVNMNCKLVILTNETSGSQIEVPCVDVISICSVAQLGSSVGYRKGINDVDDVNKKESSLSGSTDSPSDIKAVDTREADELVLRNWKSQATARFMSVLDENELLFPTVLVGNHYSRWITVKNPSQKPVLMQLILNSGEIIDNCRIHDTILQPSGTIMVGNKTTFPTRNGFSIPKDAKTEAFVHPDDTATFGPIVFQPSNRCEWRSSALIRNNLSGVEWLSLKGFGGSLSLVLLEGYNTVHNLEFELNMPSKLNFSSLDTLRSMGEKTPSCSQTLKKDVYAKNMGDLPLEIARIKVSGAECGMDGFIVHNCEGFALQPGESVRLSISYQTDFSAPTIQRDLELTLATGILVIPMKASLPICVLNFCKRSLFWMRVKKATLVIVFAVSLLYLLAFLLFPRIAASHSQGLVKSGENSSSPVIHAFNALNMHFNWKNNIFMRSIAREEPLLLESPGRCSDDLASENISPVGHQKQTAPVSRSSPVENFIAQDAQESRNLKVRVGKEKRLRRKKKRSSGGAGGLLLLEVSSQSGNSTPSSPLSPVASPTPKQPLSVPPGIEQSVEARNPFSRAPLKSDKHKCSEPSPKVDLLDNEVPLRRGNNIHAEKPNLSRKVAGRAVLLPSATFPSSDTAVPPWTCHSPFLTPKSAVAPHARAPGTKLQCQNTSGLEEKTGIDEKYTYDIWGDHLFGVPLAYQSERVSLSAIENDSESFFVKGPQTLMKNSLVKPVSSDMEGNE